MYEIRGDTRRIKWTYATRALEDRPDCIAKLDGCLLPSDDPPRRNDVVVAEVLEIERHEYIELVSTVRSRLFPGDLVGVAYGHRYATRQWRGAIPSGTRPCHLLSVGGLCGEVVDQVPNFGKPTTLRPLGYLADSNGRVNLIDHGIRPGLHLGPRSTTILVVGSSMDSGKTTAAYSIIHGPTRAGARVCAAKLTGTASAKDLQVMDDAGAIQVLDFTSVGHASTAECSREELWNITRAIDSHLSSWQPEYVVLEIADGIVQRETQMLLEDLHEHHWVDYTVYACSDTLGVQSGVTLLGKYDLNLVAVSGWVACSPLAAQEAQPYTDLPVLRADELSDPSIAKLFVQHPLEVYWQAVG